MEVREERRVLIPQFSLRWMLGLTTVCAFIFAVFGMAARGHAWAIGFTIGLGSVFLMAMIHAGLFGCVAVVAGLVPRRKTDPGACPFGSSPFGDERLAGTDGVLGGDGPLDAEIVS
ncbi:MAG TPA: hypothetical protein VJL29_05650 [Thermoguttaceae bacterium]|nr:hypothetical protein [Thermoguttaceae bacterium]